MKIYWSICKLYFHNRAAAVVLGCVADRINKQYGAIQVLRNAFLP